MTDGIIQEVFKKYLMINNNPPNSHTFYTLDRVEDELIEKIKNSIEIKACRHDRKTIDIDLLIGDTT